MAMSDAEKQKAVKRFHRLMNRKEPHQIWYDRLVAQFGLRSFDDVKDGYRIIKNRPSFMDLTLSHQYGDVFALEHHFVQNGDRMSDPRMTFWVDESRPDFKFIGLLSFEMSNPPIYQEIYGDASRRTVRPKLKKELETFFRKWLTNIGHQHFDRRYMITDKEIHAYDKWIVELNASPGGMYVRADRSAMRLGGESSTKWIWNHGGEEEEIDIQNLAALLANQYGDPDTYFAPAAGQTQLALALGVS